MNTRFGSSILDAACRLPVPFILLFAVYVVIHGHDSPGGGVSRRCHSRRDLDSDSHGSGYG